MQWLLEITSGDDPEWYNISWNRKKGAKYGQIFPCWFERDDHWKKKEPFEVCSRLFLQIPDHLTGGSNSNMFGIFTPENLGKKITHFDDIIFFIMGLVQPPTTSQLMSSMGSNHRILSPPSSEKELLTVYTGEGKETRWTSLVKEHAPAQVTWITRVGGRWFRFCLMFTPIFGVWWFNFTIVFFQMGWWKTTNQITLKEKINGKWWVDLVVFLFGYMIVKFGFFNMKKVCVLVEDVGVSCISTL